MPLDPKIEKILEKMKQSGVGSMSSITIEQARLGAELMAMANHEPRTQVGVVSDRTIPGPAGDLPIRVYRPEGKGPFPMLVFFHGGGFVVGSINSHDPLCRDLCAGSGALVISVGYRLAPENRFPAAVEDSLTAVRWIADHASEIEGDTRFLALAGDSAGANLATVTAIRIRDEGGPVLCGQVLMYPATDISPIDTTSRLEMGTKGYFITLEDMEWLARTYVSEEKDIFHPWCSPLKTDDLSRLPPTLVITAEYDPLRDEGEMYAKKLEAAGVPVTAKRYEGMIHIFLQLPGVKQANEAMGFICNWLQRVFSQN